MANAGPQPTSPDDTRCHFFKLSLELRDRIYDDIAYGQTNVELYVDLETASEPKVYAYDESRALSRTSSQLRAEYMARLQQRIKQLDIDHRASVVEPRVMARIATTLLLIAEREVSWNTFVRDAVAFRWIIPFEGTFDNGEQKSTLNFTVASGAARAFNRKIDSPAKWTCCVSTDRMLTTMEYLKRLKSVAGHGVRNWWMSLWDAHEIRMPCYRLIVNGVLVEGSPHSARKRWEIEPYGSWFTIRTRTRALSASTSLDELTSQMY
jgi:hypothetical protein